MMINQLSDQNLEDIYYDKGFLIIIESFMTSLKEGDIKLYDIPDAVNYKYIGDFYGLLSNLNIQKKYHHIVLKFNGYRNSNDYNGELNTIIVPDFNIIEQLKNVYITKNN